MRGWDEHDRGRLLARAVCTVLLLSAVVVVADVPGARAQAATTTSRFQAGTPCRLADVRAGTGFERVDDRIVRVVVGGRCQIPADATALALTVTVDSSLTTGPGFVSVWPEGQPMPTASIINFTPGQVRANGAIVGVGAGSAIDLLSSNSAPVIVDVTGWFVPTTSSAEGRFLPIAPTRALDTRQAPVAHPLAPGQTLTVALPPGVPADASAVAFTITLTQSPRPGFFTISPAGTPQPPTSVLNADAPGQTRAAGSIVGVTAAGVDIYSSSGGHVILDITGWFTGPSAMVDDDGLFVAEPAPRRLVDSRSGNPIWPGGEIEIANVGPTAAALAVNVAIVNPMRPAFLTAYPAWLGRPATSTVNATAAGDVAASMAIVPASQSGLGVFSNAGSDVVVDLAGWFVGTPPPATAAPPANVRPSDCTTSIDPDGLNQFFRTGAAFRGADYQRPFALPDGRVLWLFQDVYVSGRSGTSTFVHNAGLVQTGTCFDVLSSGNYAAPGEYLFADQTQRHQHWFWPLAGDMGSDGLFHLFVVEMRERGATYLTKVEPIATWKVSIDLATMSVVDRRLATDPSPDLYGWSVASDDQYTYLYAHCYRQFGWDAFPYVDPPVYVHDWECSDEVTVARVPKGQFDQPLAYWNGTTWGTSAQTAVNVVPSGRLVSASQFYRYGDKWLSVTKIGDWWGEDFERHEIVIDIASQPQGPYTRVRTIAAPVRCDGCSNYFPSLLPYRASDGSLLIGISNNKFDSLDLSWYDPTFIATPPV